jgi:hypothetical protein
MTRNVMGRTGEQRWPNGQGRNRHQMGHVRLPDTGSEGAPPREKRALLGGTGLENPIRLYSPVWFGSVLPVKRLVIGWR